MLQRLLSSIVARNVAPRLMVPGATKIHALPGLTASDSLLQHSRRHASDTKSVDELIASIAVPDDNIGISAETYEETQQAETSSSSLPGHRIRGILVPTMETHECLVAGQLYSSIPIANIRAGWQNTHVTVTDHTGGNLYSRKTGGGEGFKNSKKRTNVAAQAAGLAAGQEALSKGVTHVRVALRGMGKGRLAACKGLEMAGVEIVSLTDVSIVNWGAQKPKKKRRI